LGGGIESPATVLLVDEDEERGADTAAVLEGSGYRVIRALEGAAALRLLSANDCAAVLCELELPDMDGLEVCRAIKRAPATRNIPVIITMDQEDMVRRQRALQAGAADVCGRPFDAATILRMLRAQILVGEQQERIDQLEAVVITLAHGIEDRDHASSGLSEKVAHWAMQLGRALALDDQQLTALYKAALLHDIGSVAVPVAVLAKEGRLEPAEYNEIKRHPLVGEELLRPLPGSAELVTAVRHHHERIDGAGYPDGLSDDNIPLFARIIAIADAYVAMTSDRPYRRRRSREEAVAVLRQGAGKQWDTALIDRFLTLLTAAEGQARVETAG
jgi:putative two-component system response regulator